MKKCGNKQCIIGESPVWNSKEQKLYYTNGPENEICIYDIYTDELEIRKTPVSCAALCFDSANRLIVSCEKGVFVLNADNTLSAIYDIEKYAVIHANDMKFGPDGRLWVGTMSGKRAGTSDQIDGKLYSIDKNGHVRTLLDGLLLSNGLDWSADGKAFYHTDSDTHIIRKYDFDAESGSIRDTTLEIKLPGVDGLTIDTQGNLFAARWGYGEVAVISAEDMRPIRSIAVPVQIPASCAFAGRNMEYLAITTAYFGLNREENPDAGVTFLTQTGTRGKAPYSTVF